MATYGYVAPNTAIVPEFLKTDNYEYWSACLKSHLEAQDLWKTIDPGTPDRGRQYKKWQRKNSAALHAIQISCGPQFFPVIKYFSDAKDAWKTLENEFNPEPEQQPQPRGSDVSGEEVPAEPIDDQLRAQKDEMMDHITKGDWKGLRAMLDNDPSLINARIAEDGSTALHKAVRSGHLRVVEGLVGMMRPDYLEIMDNHGQTALMCAALIGNTEMARCMIRKNDKLAEIGRGILSVACLEGHKDTAIYLYTKTSIHFLSQENGKRASHVLRSCIYGKTLDIALDLLHRLPDSCKVDVIRRSEILRRLSVKPEVFRSGLGLAFWQRWIYWSVRAPEFAPSIHTSKIDMGSGSQSIDLEPGVTTDENPSKIGKIYLQGSGTQCASTR